VQTFIGPSLSVGTSIVCVRTGTRIQEELDSVGCKDNYIEFHCSSLVAVFHRGLHTRGSCEELDDCVQK
jgi:hypothetical protein